MSSRSALLILMWVAGLGFGSFPMTAHAQNISDSVQYALESMEPWSIGSLVQLAEEEDHEALQMLYSRVVVRDKPLDDYRCDDGPLDNGGVSKAGRHTTYADRLCRTYQFRNRNMDGIKSWGPPHLRERDVEEYAERAEQQTRVPAGLIVLIARFSSGFLPGLVTEDGRYGLLQMKPEVLRQIGIEPGNLLDPENNINKGAEYLRRLFIRFRNVKIVLAAFRDGPNTIAISGDVPRDRNNLWFTREMLTMYFLSIREFPLYLGAEAMTYVWQEME